MRQVRQVKHADHALEVKLSPHLWLLNCSPCLWWCRLWSVNSYKYDTEGSFCLRLDSELTYEKHLRSIPTSASQKLGVLKKLHEFLESIPFLSILIVVCPASTRVLFTSSEFSCFLSPSPIIQDCFLCQDPCGSSVLDNLNPRHNVSSLCVLFNKTCWC